MINLWKITQNNYDSNLNRKYETIFTLANGYRGMRGALEFSKKGERGNLIAGIFNQSEAVVTEIVNCQDPLGLNIYIEDEMLDIDNCQVLSFNRELDMKSGVLHTEVEIKTQKGKITRIVSQRFVSRNNVNRWGAKYSITPVNYSGKIFIENIIDGTVTNSALDPRNRTKHLEIKKVIDLKPGIGMKTSTRDKNVEIIEGTTLKATDNYGNMLKSRKHRQFGEVVRELYELDVKENIEYELEKYGVTYTSRDTKENIENLLVKNLKEYMYHGLNHEMELHKGVWNKIWDKIDIKINGDEEAQLGIRFNLYQLSSSAYEGDHRVSIAAKALHGEGYKGHVFWDTEIFMLPFFIYTNPEVAKALLMYRYNTLGGARKNATTNGYKGAQFPWESADEGVEVTPKWGFDYDGNPVRIWTGDEEFHINADIAFGIWEYYRATRDREFLVNYGIEIFLDTAKFWNSRLEYNSNKDRYEINRVIGPDEFHEHVNNNVYTNYLAKWNINKAIDLGQWLKAEDPIAYGRLSNQLGISEEDFDIWKEKKDKIYIPYAKDSKVIEQFEGYFDLKDVPIVEYDENSMPVWPDLKGYSLSETQLIKQPDVIMLMLLLGDEFDEETKKENYEYYEKRTMHKSSLSPSMYSIMGLNIGDTNDAYKYFIKTIMTDLEDNQGNASFGLHAASTGGSWQSAVFGFGGMFIDNEETINFKPWIPSNWDDLEFKIHWQGAIISLRISREKVYLNSTEETKVKVYGKEYLVEKNKELVVSK